MSHEAGDSFYPLEREDDIVLSFDISFRKTKKRDGQFLLLEMKYEEHGTKQEFFESVAIPIEDSFFDGVNADDNQDHVNQIIKDIEPLMCLFMSRMEKEGKKKLLKDYFLFYKPTLENERPIIKKTNFTIKTHKDIKKCIKRLKSQDCKFNNIAQLMREVLFRAPLKSPSSCSPSHAEKKSKDVFELLGNKYKDFVCKADVKKRFIDYFLFVETSYVYEGLPHKEAIMIPIDIKELHGDDLNFSEREAVKKRITRDMEELVYSFIKLQDKKNNNDFFLFFKPITSSSGDDSRHVMWPSLKIRSAEDIRKCIDKLKDIHEKQQNESVWRLIERELSKYSFKKELTNFRMVWLGKDFFTSKKEGEPKTKTEVIKITSSNDFLSQGISR